MLLLAFPAHRRCLRRESDSAASRPAVTALPSYPDSANRILRACDTVPAKPIWSTAALFELAKAMFSA